MEKIYYNLLHPASYGGINTLTSALAQQTKTPSRSAKQWLQTQRPYTLHRPARRKFPVRKTRTSQFAMQFQADLNDMIAHSRVNKGFRYILTVIDVFSRFAWAAPLKTKTGQELVRAFEKIFANKRPTTLTAIPHYLQTDQGKEFENRVFQSFLRRHGVVHFSVKSPFKASLVERLNRTLKCRMFRYFTHKGTYKWVNVLPHLLESYNRSVHRSLPKGMTPEQAAQSQHHLRVWLHQEGAASHREKSAFTVGDEVRISKWKKTFEKGYLPNWSEEIFKIVKVDTRFSPHMYVIQDDSGEEIEGKFYALELQKVSNPDGLYPIEKVIRRRGSRYLVKFLAYPGHYWVDELRQL